MEKDSPTVTAFVQVQRELNGAISVLRKEDEHRKEDVVRSSAKVQQLERKVQKSAQQIADYEVKLGKHRAQIDELKNSDIKQLQIQLKDKNNMVKFLTKRVKSYDEILTKKQEEFASSLKKEREVKRIVFYYFNNSNDKDIQESMNKQFQKFKYVIKLNLTEMRFFFRKTTDTDVLYPKKTFIISSCFI